MRKNEFRKEIIEINISLFIFLISFFLGGEPFIDRRWWWWLRNQSTLESTSTKAMQILNAEPAGVVRKVQAWLRHVPLCHGLDYSARIDLRSLK